MELLKANPRSTKQVLLEIQAIKIRKPKHESRSKYYFLADCLQSLGGNARRVLQMKYAEGRKIREIAES